MKKILIAILILFPSILNALDSSESVHVETLVTSSHSWDGKLLPSYQSGQPEVTILRITVEPGVELPWHTHPVINAGVMIKGKLTVITKSGERLELAAGDTIVEVIGEIHRGINSGSEPAEIIVFYAGTTKTALSEKAPNE